MAEAGYSGLYVKLTFPVPIVSSIYSQRNRRELWGS